MSIIKFPNVTFPEQYEEICKQLVLQFISKMQWDTREKLGIHGFQEQFFEIHRDWQQTPLAELISQVAKAAAGELPADEDVRGETYEAVQDLMETLFASRSGFGQYLIPEAFWQTPPGEMISLALLWIRGDELITQAQAAALAHVTTQAINQAIRDGRLRPYKDPQAPQRQGRTLVSKSDVLEIWK